MSIENDIYGPFTIVFDTDDGKPLPDGETPDRFINTGMWIVCPLELSYHQQIIDSSAIPNGLFDFLSEAQSEADNRNRGLGYVIRDEWADC